MLKSSVAKELASAVIEMHFVVWLPATHERMRKLTVVKNPCVIEAETLAYAKHPQQARLAMNKESICTDAIIVGAGPVGLFQVFELGLLGLSAHVIDSMPQIGGQCIELYPDKPIYDIPAVPVCTGRELIERLQTQIQPFSPQFHLEETVSSVQRMESGRFDVVTNTGTRFDTRVVIVAGGLGAFSPRLLEVPEAANLVGKSLHYKVTRPDLFDGKDLVIAGGGDAALDWSIALIDRARSIVLVHRSSKFRAAPAHVKRMQELCDEGRMQFFEGDILGLEAPGDELKSVRVRARSGVVQRIEADQLLVFWGLHPALGPIAEWGLTLESHQLAVDNATFQTSTPGIFVVGDVNSYPGKKKLILSGFHEAALCAFAVGEYLNPGKKVPLQYTTTSPALRRRLGVSENVDDESDPVVTPASTSSDHNSVIAGMRRRLPFQSSRRSFPISRHLREPYERDQRQHQ